MIPRALGKWLSFGAGVGIEIGPGELRVTIVRLRPSGARLLALGAIAGIRERPAAEWGAEYEALLRKAGAGHVAATVLLPREEISVRLLSLPGVAEKDLDAAIRLQVDTLHPFQEEEAVYGWARVPRTSSVLVGICRQAVVDKYALLFAEAGIRVSSFTFAAASLHSAVRLFAEPPPAFLAFAEHDGSLELYGESAARPTFSAAFDEPAEGALDLAASELRLEPDWRPVALAGLLPSPRSAPSPEYPAGDELAYAAALANACPWRTLPVNMLPAGQRASSSRAVFVPTVVLASLLALVSLALLLQGSFERRRYAEALRSEMAALEPALTRAAALERSQEAAATRLRRLEEFRSRTRRDLDTVQTLTRLLEPPAWLRSLQMTRSTVQISGEAEQAAPLLKQLDESPLLQASEFAMPIGKADKAESFAIQSQREGEPAGEATR